jgi:hypothetical protein
MNMKRHKITKDTIKKQMFFLDAKNYQNTDNLTLSELQAKSSEYKSTGNLKEAIHYAKTAAIHFGVDGMMLYLPIQCEYIHSLHEEGEIIQQDAQKVLALIFFSETNLSSRADSDEALFKLETLKTALLDITEDKDFIVHEAHQIAEQMLSVNSL